MAQILKICIAGRISAMCEKLVICAYKVTNRNGRNPALASSRTAWTRCGWYWSITAGKTLRSEYLAWAPPNIVGLKLQLLEKQVFRKKKLQLYVNDSWSTMLRLPAGRYAQYQPQEEAARTSGRRARICKIYSFLVI